MNSELIKQLAKQVHVVGDPWKNKDEPEYNWYNFREDALEKFVALIVQECLGFVNPMPGSGDIDDLALESVQDDIQQHFGIK